MGKKRYDSFCKVRSDMESARETLKSIKFPLHKWKSLIPSLTCTRGLTKGFLNVFPNAVSSEISFSLFFFVFFCSFKRIRYALSA